MHSSPVSSTAGLTASIVPPSLLGSPTAFISPASFNSPASLMSPAAMTTPTSTSGEITAAADSERVLSEDGPSTKRPRTETAIMASFVSPAPISVEQAMELRVKIANQASTITEVSHSVSFVCPLDSMFACMHRAAPAQAQKARGRKEPSRSSFQSSERNRRQQVHMCMCLRGVREHVAC